MPAATEADAMRVLEELPYADGGVEEVCAREGMIGERTFYRLMANATPELRQAYTHARETCAHVQAQKGLKEALEAKDAGLGRLRWDARRWLAGKLGPRDYGDRIQHANDPVDPILPATNEQLLEWAARLAKPKP